MTYTATWPSILAALLVSVPALAGGHETRTCDTNRFGTTHCTVKIDGKVVEHVTCSTNRFGQTNCVSHP
jgi:hypothetical protein